MTRAKHLLGIVLTTSLAFLLAACQSGFLIPNNSVSLSIDVDVPNQTLYLTYEFESPVRTMRFANSPEGGRSSSWSVIDSAMELKDGIVSRTDSMPFESVTVKVSVEQDPNEENLYELNAIGNVGLVIYSANFSVEDVRMTGLSANISPDQVVAHAGFVSNVGAKEVSLDRVFSGLFHIYFGDRAGLSYVGNAVIVSRIEPENHALKVIRDNIDPAMHWINGYFDSSGQYRPFIIVIFHHANDSLRFRIRGVAHVSLDTDQEPFGDISIRFNSDPKAWENEEIGRFARHVVVHELVHFFHARWWGIRRIPQLWMFEGLADYLAIKFAYSVGGSLSEPTFISEIERMASGCLDLLAEGNFGMPRTHPADGIVAFDDCGVVAYWLIDGRPTMADGTGRLGAVLARMQESPGTFSTRKLRRAMEAEGEDQASDLLQMLINGPRGRLWQQREELFRGAGHPDSQGTGIPRRSEGLG